ncbi:hypothetical protein L2E82_28087 [Cichorium intybus]|uniref:Uncharacterized protein n=1 Tax=Cichorium intybus TaxID=13427 RepID=A0ACB9CUT5_CICIN|nr:hypothetical protein L2E82_28087 [Cichorium intybus]
MDEGSSEEGGRVGRVGSPSPGIGCADGVASAGTNGAAREEENGWKLLSRGLSHQRRDWEVEEGRVGDGSPSPEVVGCGWVFATGEDDGPPVE